MQADRIMKVFTNIILRLLPLIHLIYCQEKLVRNLNKVNLPLQSYTTILQSVCPTYNKNRKLNGLCGKQYSSCSEDLKCGFGLKCCFDGCISTCDLPNIKTVRVSTKGRKKVPSGYWFIDHSNRFIPRWSCSTSHFNNQKPHRCPLGYACHIKVKENRFKNIPNKGYCILDPNEGLMAYLPVHLIYQKQKLDKTDCIYKQKVYHHGQLLTKKCSFCFCRHSVINCNLNPSCIASRSVDINHVEKGVN